MKYLVGFLIGFAVVWFFKAQLVAFWQWCTPFLNHAKTAAEAEVDTLLKRK
jgi:hypothetical protein